MKKTPSQIRHEKLIDFLSQFSQYQDEEGKTICKKEEFTLRSKDLQFLDINTINTATVVLSDYLNLGGGSLNDIDLYRLLQIYFKDLEKRKKINEIL